MERARETEGEREKPSRERSKTQMLLRNRSSLCETMKKYFLDEKRSTFVQNEDASQGVHLCSEKWWMIVVGGVHIRPPELGVVVDECRAPVVN